MAEDLPLPRVLVTGHHRDGSRAVSDEFITPVAVPGNFRLTKGFVQPLLNPDPFEALEYAKSPLEAPTTKGGLNARWVDVAPHTETPMHFINTIDYVVITHGTFQLKFHDGTTTDVKPGDLIVQLGNVHQWNNSSDQWARFLTVSLEIQAIKVDGKGLDEPPHNFMRF